MLINTIILVASMYAAPAPLTQGQIDSFTQCLPSEETLTEWMEMYNIENTPERRANVMRGAIYACWQYYVIESKEDHYDRRYER